MLYFYALSTNIFFQQVLWLIVQYLIVIKWQLTMIRMLFDCILLFIDWTDHPFKQFISTFSVFTNDSFYTCAITYSTCLLNLCPLIWYFVTFFLSIKYLLYYLLFNVYQSILYMNFLIKGSTTKLVFYITPVSSTYIRMNEINRRN